MKLWFRASATKHKFDVAKLQTAASTDGTISSIVSERKKLYSFIQRET